LLGEQWVAMRVIVLVIVVPGLALALFFLFQYWRYRREHYPALIVSVAGLLFMIVAEVLLILYYAIDPGFIAAIKGGYASASYEAGTSALLLFSAAFSGSSTGFMAAFWFDLLERNLLARKVFGVSPMSFAIAIGITAYYLIVVVVFVISFVAFPTSYGAEVFLGFISFMSICTAVSVVVLGEHVLAKLRECALTRKFGQQDVKRMRAIRLHYIAYAVAQIICATGLFVVQFFSEAIKNFGPSWIWAGIGFPGLLLGVAYYFILFALRRKHPTVFQTQDVALSADSTT
jgi:hypothetical protein